MIHHFLIAHDCSFTETDNCSHLQESGHSSLSQLGTTRYPRQHQNLMPQFALCILHYYTVRNIVNLVRCSQRSNDSTMNNSLYQTRADTAIAALQAWYDPTTTLYSGVTWWHSAICLD